MRTKLQMILSVALLVTGFALAFFLLRPNRPQESTPARSDRPVQKQPESAAVVSTKPAPPAIAPVGATPRFVDVTATSGIDFRHENGHTGQFKYLEIMGAGVGLLDYDGDGWLDLYLVNGNRIGPEASPDIVNRLYRNNGDWTFTDVTRQAGVGHAGYGQGCCVGDFDHDGTSDLYVSNFGPDVLYRNNGDGTFTDVTSAAGLARTGWGQSCAFLDYDGDGHLDLYVQNYLELDPQQKHEAYIYVGRRKVLDYPSPLGFPGQADRLYRNRGNGTFVDVTEEANFLYPGGKGMGVACADLNDDGRIDIFVANDTMENYLFFNQGDGTFQESGLVAGAAFNRMGVPEASMGVDVGDYDGDGRLDLIIPCYRHQFFTLLRNVGGRFEDDSVTSGLAKATARATGFNGNFLDYDNDGDLDLFCTAGAVRMNETAPADASYNQRYGLPDLLMANDGQGRFVDVSESAGDHFQQSLIGRGAATGDLDNDGDLDIVISNLADRTVILRNDTPGGHWITLDLIDVDGRRNPIGTSVWIEAAGVRRRAYIHDGVTYLSQSDQRVHIGLGTAQPIDRVEITWPDGATQVVEDLEVDQFLEIRAGQ
jgi:hypothetical protein